MELDFFINDLNDGMEVIEIMCFVSYEVNVRCRECIKFDLNLLNDDCILFFFLLVFINYGNLY